MYCTVSTVVIVVYFLDDFSELCETFLYRFEPEIFYGQCVSSELLLAYLTSCGESSSFFIALRILQEVILVYKVSELVHQYHSRVRLASLDVVEYLFTHYDTRQDAAFSDCEIR